LQETQLYVCKAEEKEGFSRDVPVPVYFTCQLKSIVSLSFYFQEAQPTALSCCKPQDWFIQQRQTVPIGYCQPS